MHRDAVAKSIAYSFLMDSTFDTLAKAVLTPRQTYLAGNYTQQITKWIGLKAYSGIIIHSTGNSNMRIRFGADSILSVHMRCVFENA